MRIFTGIALPPEPVAALSAAIDSLRPLAEIAWTREEKFHITTRFIGEWPETRLDELQQALATLSAPEPIEIRFTELAWLPNGRQPNILHAAVAPAPPLKRLASDTDAALLQIGLIPEPRLYRPHVTLGRVRRGQYVHLGALRSAVKDFQLSAPPFIATAFHLYLSAEGTYTKLKDFPLTA